MNPERTQHPDITVKVPKRRKMITSSANEEKS